VLRPPFQLLLLRMPALAHQKPVLLQDNHSFNAHLSQVN
jgi:hypothetical protein